MTKKKKKFKDKSGKSGLVKALSGVSTFRIGGQSVLRLPVQKNKDASENNKDY